MKYFDQHVHTVFSVDSKEDPAAYLGLAKRAGLERFVSTDHLEFNWNNEGKDWLPDFSAQKKLYESLSREFPSVSIEQGVEIGYKSDKIAEINDIVRNNALTHVNLSVHDYEGYDLYYSLDDKFSSAEIIEGNLEKIAEAVASDLEYDILCHVDYAFKTQRAKDPSLRFSAWEYVLKRIFSAVAERGKAIEINLKVQSVIDDKEHIKYILGLFRECGGRFVTLSSDAHKADKYLVGLEKYASIISESGFDSLCFFINRRPELAKISELFPLR